ncbi:hypothetical protein TR74_05365 [Carbonactinospora thermoautotrophica]|uniref:Uncharacterized protein n=1 Tax=Carbonactinospora thermoautotrophica TaxID=1469144 RepID=A0A132NJ42_9ACTN|nr:hypothetical protein TR74_05365 [Carbonactinospora thermoautotrophica]
MTTQARSSSRTMPSSSCTATRASWSWSIRSRVSTSTTGRRCRLRATSSACRTRGKAKAWSARSRPLSRPPAGRNNAYRPCSTSRPCSRHRRLVLPVPGSPRTAVMPGLRNRSSNAVSAE